MKTPTHILATMMAAAMVGVPDGSGRRLRSQKKPKPVDKAKRAKRRAAKASRKRNRQ